MKMKIPFFASLEISGGFEAGGGGFTFAIRFKKEGRKIIKILWNCANGLTSIDADPLMD